MIGKNSFRARAAVLAALAASAIALAASPACAKSAEEEIEALDWIEGPAVGKVGDVAEQKIPDGYMFLERKDVNKFLELTENLPDDEYVAVIAHPDGDWWACYSYSDIGYVKDDEKDSLDSDALLNALRLGIKENNKERRKRGWTELKLTGWKTKPHYDARTHNLEWAIRASSTDGVGINYNTRYLGRGGVTSVELMCDPDNFHASLREFKKMLEGFSYTPGNKYSEYRSGDRLADVGLTALIAGGAAAAAAKTGLFKGFWKTLALAAAGIAWLFGKIKNFFKRLAGIPEEEASGSGEDGGDGDGKDGEGEECEPSGDGDGGESWNREQR